MEGFLLFYLLYMLKRDYSSVFLYRVEFFCLPVVCLWQQVICSTAWLLFAFLLFLPLSQDALLLIGLDEKQVRYYIKEKTRNFSGRPILRLQKIFMKSMGSSH